MDGFYTECRAGGWVALGLVLGAVLGCNGAGGTPSTGVPEPLAGAPAAVEPGLATGASVEARPAGEMDTDDLDATPPEPAQTGAQQPSMAAGDGTAATPPMGLPQDERDEQNDSIEALLDPRYDDQIHPGPCPVVEQDADRETVVELLGGDAYRGEERYATLSTRGGLLNLGIGVAGGADYTRVGAVECPDPAARTCAERDEARAVAEAIGLHSQRCVQALTRELGGEVTEASGFGNSFSAQLTWAQSLRLAAHPHLQSLSDSDETTPVP